MNPPEENLYKLFLNRVQENPGLAAFNHKVGNQRQDVTREAALDRIRNITSGLKELGVGPGDRVALLSVTQLDWALVDMAIYARGGVVVPIFPTSTTDETRFILEDSGASILFVDSKEHADQLLEINSSILKTIIIMASDVEAKDRQIIMKSFFSANSGGDDDDAGGKDLSRDDLATLIYTSGTTGRPKGTMLTHGNILSNVKMVGEVYPLGLGYSCLSWLPLAHVYERTSGWYSMLDRGVKICYAESVETIVQDLSEVGPTIFLAVPRIYEKIYSNIQAAAQSGSVLRQKISRYAFSVALEVAAQWQERMRPVRHSVVPDTFEKANRLVLNVLSPWLRIKYWFADVLVFQKIRNFLGGRVQFAVSGGAPLAPNIAKFFFGVGLPLHEGYGLTETSPTLSFNRPGAIRFGSVGQPVDGVEIKIAEDGEVLCKGPNVMRGYLNLDKETQEALIDGWFHTGDLGRLDEYNYLWITGRKKAIIVLSNGKNVAPQELESVLKQDSLISQVVPWGDNKPFITALIVPNIDGLAAALGQDVPKSGSERAELCAAGSSQEFVMGRIDKAMDKLASYKRIKKIYLHPDEMSQESGEMTPTLKVKMRVITKKYGEKMEALYD